MKYDKEHKDSLSKYPELKERMQSLLQNGEKITPKQWKAEIKSLQSEYDSIGKEQTKPFGMTQKAVTETIRICKDRNILRQYLSSKEVEVVTIMMSLFDEEQIMKSFIKSER